MRPQIFLFAFAGVLCAGTADAQSASVCPDDFQAFAGTSDPLACSCDAEATQRGYVRGMDVYADVSSICMAAVHAGAIGADGGDVTVIPEPGRQAYAGVTRNGVESANFGSSDGSFRFETGGQSAAAKTPTPENAPEKSTTASVCPDDFQAFAGSSEPLACSCDAEATQRGYVRGMDVYAGVSSICMAAVHAGVIGKDGGDVTVVPEVGRKAYAGVTRNGIESANFGSSDGSFRFEAGSQTAAASKAGGSTEVSGAVASVCPDDFQAFTGTTDALACSCDAEATQRGYVRGMDVYAGVSSICMAAVHAGVIGADGGEVKVVPEAGRQAYAGVTRNGIASANFGSSDGSFRFDAGGQTASANKSGAQGSGAVASVCPDDFQAFAGTEDPLGCSCDGEATQRGYVRGMDVYADVSSVCMAAVHAGAIGADGGDVKVLPEAGRKAYPGVTRNGIQSANFGPSEGSFRFEMAAAAPVDEAQPVQKPIAETIEETGEVALYVQFEFNSDKLDPSAETTLLELRDTLNNAPKLRLMLVGHTDAVGAREYNQDLSLRRAVSVMSWLTAHGVEATRLSVDGKGFDQPIASNDSESGRAQNRRVQAVRVN